MPVLPLYMQPMRMKVPCLCNQNLVHRHYCGHCHMTWVQRPSSASHPLNFKAT